MRDCIAGKRTADGVPLGPALSALVVFMIAVVIGFALTLVFSIKTLFLFALVAGILLAVLTFFTADRVMHLLPGFHPFDRVVGRYHPYLQRMSTAGFEAAAEHAKAIVRLAISVTKTQPSVFRACDESLHFFMAKMVNISDAKSLLGDDGDLRRQFGQLQTSIHSHMQLESSGKRPTPLEKASLDTQFTTIQSRLDRMEEINRAALSLTTELLALRKALEEAVTEQLTGEAEVRRGSEMLKLQLTREQRLTFELRQLGL
jgi:hypothetical protein